MNRFTKLYESKQIDEAQGDPSGLKDLILMNFYRLANNPRSNERQILLLTAALSLINSANDSRAVTVARRLYQQAMG